MKSEKNDCKICKFFKELMDGQPKQFGILTITVFLLFFIVVGVIKISESYNLNKKYQMIISKTPILKCGAQEQINPSNYKVLLADSIPIIEVFYSKTKVVSYGLSDCSIIQEVLNADLGRDNVVLINSELKHQTENLKNKIAMLKKQNNELIGKNAQIKKDYNLPTQKQLDLYFNKYKQSKQKDINLYLRNLQSQEKKRLAKARVESIQMTDDCYDETEFDMTDTETYTLWLAGKCNEIRWRLKNRTKQKIQKTVVLQSFEDDPSAYKVHKKDNGEVWYEKK